MGVEAKAMACRVSLAKCTCATRPDPHHAPILRHSAAPLEAVIPADAGIQYCRALIFDHKISGILGRPVKSRAMTARQFCLRHTPILAMPRSWRTAPLHWGPSSPRMRGSSIAGRSCSIHKSTHAEYDRIGSRSRASEVLARRRALTVEMIHKIGEAWKIPADPLVRPYKIERAA
jgi:hypothetical protein